MLTIKFPKERLGTGSLPHESDATRALARFYEELSPTMCPADLKLAVAEVRGKLIGHSMRFTDGYVPHAIAVIGAGASLGEVLIAFPQADGRPLTVHTFDEVPDVVVDRITHQFLSALMEMVGPPSVRELLQQL